MALQHRNDQPDTAVLPAPANEQRGWTEQDDAIMVAQYRPGRAPYLAALLGRSVVAIHKRVKKLGLTTPQRRLPDVPHRPVNHASPALVVELAEARMEADALRVLLALIRGYLSDDEAGRALGVSADMPPPVNGRAAGTTSPLALHAATQAAIGMDLASRRIGGGGCLGEREATMDGRTGSGRFAGRGAGGAG